MTDLLINLKMKHGNSRPGIATILLSLSSVLIFSFPGSLSAQIKAADDKKLVQLLASLKNADGYTYTTRLQSTIVGDTQKTPVQTTINYGSQSEFIMYSKSNLELVFLCSEGQFKVDETQKEVYYKIFQNDSELNAVKELYLTQATGAFDSIFLTGATIKQSKLTKSRATYELSYPKAAAMKEFKIQAKLPGGNPERIEYSIDRSLNQGGQRMMIRQKLIMDHYSRNMPQEVTELLAESKDLPAFLGRKYGSYTFRKI